MDDPINSDPVDIVRSNRYPMISDVNSLAWGICEDSKSQHEKGVFRELLFVVGARGLTVHAFCQPNECNESFKSMPDEKNGEGIWVEWGPSASSRDAMHLSKPDNEQSRWLKTFLTQVTTVKSEGNLCSRFPEKSQFPSSTAVVSFNPFENNYTLLRFMLNENTNLDPEGDEMNISYKCCRVFVNSSHDLIGFVLTSFSVNTNDESERKQRKSVLIGKIVSWGIQWVCSVNLDDDVYMVPVDQWTDFKFSEKYLICLSSIGKIFFFGDVTGEYVGCANLVEMYRLKKFCNQSGDIVAKSVFRTLLVASHSSLLAAVDDYGIVYVVHASDHVLDINNSVEKSLPQFQQLRNRTLVGWEVGGADISHQRLNDNLSPNITLLRDKIVTNESVITGFSAASQIVGNKINSSELAPCVLRSIFLPTDKYSKADIICLSPFGITRLSRKYDSAKRGISRVIHLNLHVHSKGSNGEGEEITVGEAVGCVLNGCFYLVTVDGLSVVLPSISVASGCIPIEAIGYRQISSCSLDQAVNLIEIKGLKQPWPTWKIEVLDRVLLYEGHEEADHLCSENGKIVLLIFSL